MKFGSGVNVTTPFSSTVYVPSLGTTTLPSSSAPTNDGFTSGSISIVTFSPFTVVVPGVNTGVPVCFAP